MEKDNDTNLESVVLGGGCFWCLEAIFDRVEGVTEVRSGYAGGQVKNPSYQQVCTGTTGHAEVVRITFDTRLISLKELLEIFWLAHDPTTPNRQGNDVGPQYRSIILYRDESQKKAAFESMKAAPAILHLTEPIVTELVALKEFYPAEDYHRDYYDKNRAVPYCTFVIHPKLKKLGLE